MDYTYLYSTRIQKNFDEDQAEILSMFADKFEKEPKFAIQLINYYKGMPVSFKARVAGVEKGSLDLDVNPQQAVTIDAERYTFIRSNLFKYDIMAQAQYINIRRRAVLLRKMCYVEIIAERRSHIRLEMESSIDAIFNSPAGIVKGKIVELSMGGAVMEVIEAGNAVLDDQANLLMMVSDAGQSAKYNIAVPAMLVSILDNLRPVRFIFSITTDKISDRLIAKHLFNRQVEIIRELKDASGLR